MRRARTRQRGENEIQNVRRSGVGGADALAAEPTVAAASGAAGKVFGSADRPTKELLEIADALQPSLGANPQWLQVKLPTTAESPPKVRVSR